MTRAYWKTSEGFDSKMQYRDFIRELMKASSMESMDSLQESCMKKHEN